MMRPLMGDSSQSVINNRMETFVPFGYLQFDGTVDTPFLRVCANAGAQMGQLNFAFILKFLFAFLDTFHEKFAAPRSYFYEEGT